MLYILAVFGYPAAYVDSFVPFSHPDSAPFSRSIKAVQKKYCCVFRLFYNLPGIYVDIISPYSFQITSGPKADSNPPTKIHFPCHVPTSRGRQIKTSCPNPIRRKIPQKCLRQGTRPPPPTCRTATNKPVGRWAPHCLHAVDDESSNILLLA